MPLSEKTIFSEISMNVLNAIALVAEEKIKEAQKEGIFDNLPGAGKPLVLEDLSHIPQEMRMAYTILRNSGHLNTLSEDLPPYLEKNLKAAAPDEGKIHGKMRRFDVMMRRIQRHRDGQDSGVLPPLLDSPYLDKLLKQSYSDST